MNEIASALILFGGGLISISLALLAYRVLTCDPEVYKERNIDKTLHRYRWRR